MPAQIEERFDGPLTIEHTRYGDEVIVIALRGEFDLGAGPVTNTLLEAALGEPRAMVVLDLTQLEFIDVKGIHLLYELSKAREDNDLLRLLPSTHPGVNKVLELTGVPSVIPTAAALSEAI
jgi:anti-anti-sigma factor